MHRSFGVVCVFCIGAVAIPCANAQGFTPGNLIVSRTVYAGDAATVRVGQALPGGGTAIADGSFPNVFKNESADPSFGVSSLIYLDQLTLSGNVVSRYAVDPGIITSSFASKSELALNISNSGTSVTFMGYAAPKNTLDVSNSNTAAVVDATNPVPSTYSRAIADKHMLGAGLDAQSALRTENRVQRETSATGFPTLNLNEDYDAVVNRLAFYAQDEWTPTGRQ